MTAKVRFSVTLDEHEYDELAVNEFCGRYRSEDIQLPLYLTGTPPEYRGA